MVSRAIIGGILGILILGVGPLAAAQNPDDAETPDPYFLLNPGSTNEALTTESGGAANRMTGAQGTVIIVQPPPEVKPLGNHVASKMWGAGWTAWFVGDIGIGLIPNCPSVPRVAAPMAWGGLVVLSAGTGYQIGNGEDVLFYGAVVPPTIYAGYITGKRRMPNGVEIPLPRSPSVFRRSSWRPVRVTGGKVGSLTALGVLLTGATVGYLDRDDRDGPGNAAERLEYTVLPQDQAAAIIQTIQQQGLSRQGGESEAAPPADPARAPWLPQN